MKKSAFLFPGQASQYAGMAKDLYDEFEAVRRLFESASPILGYDLADVCFNGPADRLKQTAYTQPAVFIHSCAVNLLLNNEGIIPDSAAGHSLGEYSALVCCGALDFGTAMKAVAFRSRAMQDDCDNHRGTMAAIMGLDYDDVIETLRSVSGMVVPANYNSPGQVVISGELEAVSAACDLLKEKGAKRAIPIAVGGAYHSPLMDRSAAMMKRLISEEINLSDFRFPVYSNVSAEPVDDPHKFKTLLARQISRPVLWFPILRNMYADGIRQFIEVGPGQVLQGLARKSIKENDIEISGIDTLVSLREFLRQGTEVKS